MSLLTFELLQSKMKRQEKELRKNQESKSGNRRAKKESNPLEDFMDTSAGRQVSRSMVRVVERGILGVLKKLF